MSHLLRFGVWPLMGISLSLIAASGLKASEHDTQLIDPDVIRICINQLLYDHTFADGTPVGERTIIDPSAASLACRGVQFEAEAQAVRQCVNSLLYESTFSDGKPAGERTIIDPTSAARACTLCKGHH